MMLELNNNNYTDKDMKFIGKEQQIINILPIRFRQDFMKMNIIFDQLQEIRIRIGQTIYLYCNENELGIYGKKNRVIPEDIQEMLAYISQYSLYAYEYEVKQGFITIQGGHRVGLVGQAIIEENRIKNLKNISSLNIRVAHQVRGCSHSVVPYLIERGRLLNTLFIAPPKCGKTTMLRDVIRYISNHLHMTVGVVDERSELAACYHGVPQNDLGCRTDILDACPKVDGLLMLVRSMSPQVVVVDEIGGRDEIETLEYAMCCGCVVIASVHGMDWKDIQRKPVWNQLIKQKLFERYVVLSQLVHGKNIKGVYDANGTSLYEAHG